MYTICVGEKKKKVYTETHLPDKFWMAVDRILIDNVFSFCFLQDLVFKV